MREELRSLISTYLRWRDWEAVIRGNGIEIDRPNGSTHPRYPDIVYPIDYGFVCDTSGGDGDELDVFVGSGTCGLVAAIFTVDYRRGDRECKLIYDCAPTEIYVVNGFINYDRSLMEGTLIMRHPMRELW